MTSLLTFRSRENWARIAGGSLLLVILCSLASNDLVVGNPATTALNIMAHELRFRIGLVGEILMLNADVFLAAALYVLLKPVNAGLALVGSLWRLGNALLQAIGVTMALVAVEILGDKHAATVFQTNQVQVTARQLLDVHGTAMLVGLVLFAMGAGTHAWLLWKARYIPRLLSGAYVVVELIILVSCFGIILFPAVDAAIDPWFILPDAVVELLVALWLLIKGVNVGPENVALSSGG